MAGRTPQGYLRAAEGDEAFFVAEAGADRSAPAAAADRIGAGASFHGGGLVTDNPNSPHLLAPKIKARMYFGIAANDDMRQPDAKDKLKAAFAAANVSAMLLEFQVNATLPAKTSSLPFLHG